MSAAFDDRVVTLRGAPKRLTRLAHALASPTRVAILDVLVRADEPLHINEVARRVKVDASPTRTHLQVLAAEGLVVEVDEPSRRRRFTTSIQSVELALVGARRDALAPDEAPTKEEAKLVKRLDHLARKHERLQEEADAVRAELHDLRGRARRPSAP